MHGDADDYDAGRRMSHAFAIAGQKAQSDASASHAWSDAQPSFCALSVTGLLVDVSDPAICSDSASVRRPDRGICDILVDRRDVRDRQQMPLLRDCGIRCQRAFETLGETPPCGAIMPNKPKNRDAARLLLAADRAAARPAEVGVYESAAA